MTTNPAAYKSLRVPIPPLKIPPHDTSVSGDYYTIDLNTNTIDDPNLPKPESNSCTFHGISALIFGLLGIGFLIPAYIGFMNGSTSTVTQIAEWASVIFLLAAASCCIYAYLKTDRK